MISGGIDDREILAMRSVEMADPLALEFAEPGSERGDTLSGVVDIHDPAGRIVLNTVTDGPLLFVDVPAGTYVVTAGYKGNAQQLQVVVGSRTTEPHYVSW